MSFRDDQVETLSPPGPHRREIMLAELQREMSTFHRQRRLRRRAAAVAVAPIMALLAWVLWSQLHRGAATPQIVHNEQPRPSQPIEPAVSQRRGAMVETIETDPALAARFNVSTQPYSVSLTDDELLDVLAAINRPAGLVHWNDRTTLTQNVTDDPIAQ
jgi:hypothetical protein